jgi:hypothetical protein
MRIGIHINATEYTDFKALMPNEQRLEKTYSAWKQRRLQEDSRSGEEVKTITIHPAEFELYCLQIGQRPNYSVLEAYAVIKARLGK